MFKQCNELRKREKLKEENSQSKMPKMLLLQGTGKTETMGMRLIDLLIPLGDPQLEERSGGVGHSSSPCDKGRGRGEGGNEQLNTADSFLNTATGFFINLQIQFILWIPIHTEHYLHLMGKVHSCV